MNGNSIVTTVHKPISQENYNVRADAIKYLPWTIVNSEASKGQEPISAFSSTIFWFLYPNYTKRELTTGPTIVNYGALNISNFKEAIINVTGLTSEETINEDFEKT